MDRLHQTEMDESLGSARIFANVRDLGIELLLHPLQVQMPFEFRKARVLRSCFIRLFHVCARFEEFRPNSVPSVFQIFGVRFQLPQPNVAFNSIKIRLKLKLE